MFVTRVEHFCAAHRLYSPHLSDEENRKAYEKCNRTNGHGHNYKIEVTIVGPVDEKTGMVINLADLGDLIWKHALETIDHHNIDKDVEYFHRVPSTTENVVRYLWEKLVDKISSPARLYEIVLHETDKIYVKYRGPDDLQS